MVLKVSFKPDAKPLEDLLMQASEDGDIAIVKAMIQVGANVNAKSYKGWTALMYAAMKENINVVKLLIETSTIDLNIKIKTGWTALSIAASYDSCVAVEMLIAAGADVNCTNNVGYTPLFHAASRANLRIVNALVSCPKTDVNIKDDDGRTALMWAAFRNRFEVIKALVKAGADVNVKDSKGNSASMLATQHDIIAFLKAEEAKQVKPEEPAEQVKPDVLYTVTVPVGANVEIVSDPNATGVSVSTNAAAS